MQRLMWPVCPDGWECHAGRMTLLWLHVRYRYRALLGIRDVRQGRLRAQIEQAKVRRARRSISEEHERFGRSLATAFAEDEEHTR